jgi:hypothetical protein
MSQKGFLKLNVLAFLPQDINTNEHDEEKLDENGEGQATDNQQKATEMPNTNLSKAGLGPPRITC